MLHLETQKIGRKMLEMGIIPVKCSDIKMLQIFLKNLNLEFIFEARRDVGGIWEGCRGNLKEFSC